jgi:hypothetical protein
MWNYYLGGKDNFPADRMAPGSGRRPPAEAQEVGLNAGVAGKPQVKGLIQGPS